LKSVSQFCELCAVLLPASWPGRSEPTISRECPFMQLNKLQGYRSVKTGTGAMLNLFFDCDQVINTMHVRQTSTPHLTFWGLYFIDTQDPSSYTLLKGEQVNNFKYFM